MSGMPPQKQLMTEIVAYESLFYSDIEPYQVLRFKQALTFVNNTALDTYIIVPKNEMWMIEGVISRNTDSVTRNGSIYAYDKENDIMFIGVDTSAAGAGGYVTFPHGLFDLATETHPPQPVLLIGGDKIRVYWAAGGASTGGTGYVHIYGKKRLPVK